MSTVGAVDIIENSYPADTEYVEDLIANPETLAIVWRHFRTKSSAAIAAHGHLTDVNGPANIELKNAAEELAYSQLEPYFEKFATNSEFSALQVITPQGTAMFIKTNSAQYRFVIEQSPETSSLGEILFYSYIQQ